eukprot:tig00001187_g7467.t1
MGAQSSKDAEPASAGFFGLGKPHNKVSAEQLVELSKTLETGDLVMMCTPGSLHSILVQGSRWTHVGVVYRRDGKYNVSRDKWHEERNDPETVYLLEACQILGTPTRPPFNGMNLSPLPWRISSYLRPGKAARAMGIRRLKNVRRTPEFLMRMEQLWHEVKDREYEKNFLQMANSAIDCFDADWCLWNPTRNEADETSLFCSELVAMTFQRLGVIASGPGAAPSNEYCPADFGEDRMREKIPLVNGAAFDDIIWATSN